MTTQKRRVSSLLPGIKYIARVRAYNGLGVPSDWSEALVFTTPTSTVLPSPPNFLVTNYLTSTLVMSWTAANINTDGSTLIDFAFYEITFTGTSGSVVHTSTVPSYSYTQAQNIADFGSAQLTLGIEIRTVNLSGRKSLPLAGTAVFGVPPTPLDAPLLVSAFTLITITATGGRNDTWAGYYIETSTNGITYTPLVTLTGQDTYIHSVTAGSTHYYRYKVIDIYGNMSGFSPVASTTTHIPLVIDGFTIVDNLAVTSHLVISGSGDLSSFNFTGSSGYILTSTGATFQNGGVSIVGAGGALTLDSTSLRAIYGGNTVFLANASGVQIAGNLVVDFSGIRTTSPAFSTGSAGWQIQKDGTAEFQSVKIRMLGSSIIGTGGGSSSDSLKSTTYSAGTSGWMIDATGNVEFNNGTFRGNIVIGSGSSIFKADTNGIYLGNATFASAPFSVDLSGVVTSASFETASSGQRIVMSGGTYGFDYINWFDSSGSRSAYIRSGTQSIVMQTVDNNMADNSSVTVQALDSQETRVFIDAGRLDLGRSFVKGDRNGNAARLLTRDNNEINFEWTGSALNAWIGNGGSIVQIWP